MVFCGQCGLQLAQGSTRCPRCGAVVEEPGIAAEELHSDDPTVASPAISGPRTQQTPPGQPFSGQQPLVLGSTGQPNGYNKSTQLPYDATSMVNPADYTQQQQPGNSYANYPAQPNQANNYPSLTTGAYAAPQTPYGNNNYATGMSYPNTMQPQTGYQQIPGQNYPQDQLAQTHTAANARGRTAGLVLILFGLIFIFGAVILFAIQNHII
jgi:hypothetical protein